MTQHDIRARARTVLATTTGEPIPEWRTCWPDSTPADEPHAIGPVCTDDDHDPHDGSVYSCCPDPVIDCGDPAIAAYLVQLLNADRDRPPAD